MKLPHSVWFLRIIYEITFSSVKMQIRNMIKYSNLRFSISAVFSSFSLWEDKKKTSMPPIKSQATRKCQLYFFLFSFCCWLLWPLWWYTSGDLYHFYSSKFGVICIYTKSIDVYQWILLLVCDFVYLGCFNGNVWEGAGIDRDFYAHETPMQCIRNAQNAKERKRERERRWEKQVNELIPKLRTSTYLCIYIHNNIQRIISKKEIHIYIYIYLSIIPLAIELKNLAQ